MALKPQIEEFCYKYVANNYNGAQAYEEVYGAKANKNNAAACASRLLKNPEVAEKIKEIRKDKLRELQIDADRVTEKLAEIAFSTKGDDYYNATAQLKALDILSKQFGMQIQKVESKQEIIEVGVV